MYVLGTFLQIRILTCQLEPRLTSVFIYKICTYPWTLLTPIICQWNFCVFSNFKISIFLRQREQWERNEEELKREKMRKKEKEADKLTTILPLVDVESPRLEPMVLPANAAAGDHEPLILQEVPLSPSPVSSSSSNQFSPVAT